MDLKLFSERIRELRGSKSQREVASAIGTTQQSLGRYENGTRKPDLEIVESLARYFQVSSDYLLGLNNQPSPHYDLHIAADVIGVTPPAVEHLLEMRSDETIYGFEELLDYVLGVLPAELMRSVMRAQNQLMARHCDRVRMLEQYNQENGTDLPKQILSSDLNDYSVAEKLGMKAELIKFNAYYEKVVLDRCQEELKKPDKITVETAAEFEQKCKQYAEYQMYRADQMWDTAMQDVKVFLRTIRTELFDNWVFFNQPPVNSKKEDAE